MTEVVADVVADEVRVVVVVGVVVGELVTVVVSVVVTDVMSQLSKDPPTYLSNTSFNSPWRLSQSPLTRKNPPGAH